jgi:signal transduction histidine kinase
MDKTIGREHTGASVMKWTHLANGSTARLLARSAFAVCAALIVSALYLGFARSEAAVERGEFGAQDVLFYLSDFAFVGIGALVASRRPDNRVGWFFIAAGAVGAVADFAEQWALDAFTKDSPLPLGPEAAWVYGSFNLAIASFLALAVLYFPTGRLPSPAWGWVARVAAAGIALSVVNAALLWRFRGSALLEDPVDVPGSADLLANAGLVILIVTALAASVASLLVRFRRAQMQERQQIKWLAYTASLVLMVLLVGFVPGLITGSGPSISAEVAGALAILAMPTAAGIAILKYRLFDIDLIIRQSLVYGGLALLISALYVALGALLGIDLAGRLHLAFAVLLTLSAVFVVESRRRTRELVASRTRLVQAQDAERRRIGRDLHDGVQQDIVALAAKLSLARNQLRRDPELAASTLAELQSEAKETLDELRDVAQGIHPPLLSDRGLLEAIEARTGRLPIGVTMQSDSVARGQRFPEEIEAAAYFFVSEALTNVLKHSQAITVAISLSFAHDELGVAVADDGIGFGYSEPSGSGLTGLKDRIEAVGGKFQVTTQLGVGTTLFARLPIERGGGVG